MTNQLNHQLTTLEEIIELNDKTSLNKQIQIVQDIAKLGEEGLEALLNLLVQRRIINKMTLVYLDGILFETLNSTNINNIQYQLNSYFKNGLIDFKSETHLNYQPLQKLLMSQQFQEADKLTQIQLCQLAGLNNSKNRRNWLYFTDISFLPSEDIEIIDTLWRIYSRGKFGFSIQRQIWLANDCNWEKLWAKIGWTNQGVACRYPNEFIWNINAPKGHLPLFNQLRGVQVLAALFKHIVWTKPKYNI